MSNNTFWFDAGVIGQYSPNTIDAILENDDPFEREEAALFADEGLESMPLPKGWLPQSPITRDKQSILKPLKSQPKPWMHTSHCFGFIPAVVSPGQTAIPIRAISNIRPSKRLQNARVTITLDRLRIASYPGGRGIHQVLVHVYAQNQTSEGLEGIHFNNVYRVRENEQAAIRGYPLFVGLSVGSLGLRIRCRTVNVCNDQDEAFLSVLDADVFKAGLQIATTAQPVLAPFSHLAFGMAKAIASRHRNISVQDIDLGLDFGSSPLGARLAEGSYLAVQMGEEQLIRWNWDDWMYHPSSGQILHRTNSTPLGHNYLVFSIGLNPQQV